MLECQTSNSELCLDRIATLEGDTVVTYDDDDTPQPNIPNDKIVVRPFADLNH